MKTLLIGGRGQLGHDLAALLGDDAIVLDLPEFDVTDAGRVEAALREHRPRWVINCAAQTNVDRCEDEVAEAFAINAQGARHVAQAAERVQATAVFISTDYVFGADAGRLLACGESDVPGPVNVYGASKLAGEHLTLAYSSRALVVRTSGLYGHAGARGKGGNFVETMLRLAREKQPIRVVEDQYLSPTSTVECAAKVLNLCQLGARGVVHVAASDYCSWFQFAREIFDHVGLRPSFSPIASSEYPAKARRPAMSALRSERLPALCVDPCRNWQEMLYEYLETRPCETVPRTPCGGAKTHGTMPVYGQQ